MTGQSDRRNYRTNRLIVLKKHRKRYYMTRFIATMIMTLTCPMSIVTGSRL